MKTGDKPYACNTLAILLHRQNNPNHTQPIQPHTTDCTGKQADYAFAPNQSSHIEHAMALHILPVTFNRNVQQTIHVR